MTVKLLTEYYFEFLSLKGGHTEFLSLKGGHTGSSESTLAKMPHCWKSHIMAHIYVWLLSIARLKCCDLFT